jgi:hypothetical protein
MFPQVMKSKKRVDILKISDMQLDGASHCSLAL